MLKPFANESEVTAIGDLTIENREDRVSFYGSLDITRDQAGLVNALALKALFDSIVGALQTEKDLPVSVQIIEPQIIVNPFASIS